MENTIIIYIQDKSNSEIVEIINNLYDLIDVIAKLCNTKNIYFNSKYSKIEIDVLYEKTKIELFSIVKPLYEMSLNGINLITKNKIRINLSYHELINILIKKHINFKTK